jgi:hypothetical protein
MSPFDFSGPSTTGPTAREKARQHRRDLNIKLLVPDAKGSATVNEHSPVSIVIGGKTDEGKRFRLSKGWMKGG